MNVNESQALQSVPSKARTHIVSEPPALTTLNPDVVEVGRSDRDGRVGGVVGVAGRPEIAAVGRRPAVPKLILGGRIAISVGVRHPACHLRPLIGLQTVVSNRRDRRRVRLCREVE